jgi:hypothetical protein
VRLHEVENSLLEVVKHPNLHCMKDGALQEMTNDTGNMSKQIESSVDRAR